MANTVNTGWLKDHNGEKFAPKTLISQVQTSDGVLLEDKIQEDFDIMKEEMLESISTEVDEAISKIPTPDVSGQINAHNTATDSHNDIRLLIEGLNTRLNTLADSDDTTLDQMSEIVAYIKSNTELIDGITTNKVSVSDIIDNLTTNVSNKPLSAAQGVALKALIDAIVVPTKLSELDDDSTHRLVTDTEKSTWSSKANTSDIPTKVSDLTNDVGYLTSTPVTSVNSKTGDIVLVASDVSALSATNPVGTGSFSMNRKSSTTVGSNSHTEGSDNIASATNSHAEGQDTTASGSNSHAEGSGTKASGLNSHTEGSGTKASGTSSHAEGYGTTASGDYGSHAEGQDTTASGYNAHAEGHQTTASKSGSHAEGYGTLASSQNQHVQGKWNIEDRFSKYAHIVGNGSISSASNAHTIDWEGNAWFQGDVYVGSTSGTNKDDGSKKLATEEYVNSIDIPTKTSELTNDSGYITSYTETDPTVPAWAKASTKPTYTASEVGALPISGGTMTGAIDVSGTSNVLDFGTTGYFRGITSSGNKFDFFALINSTKFRVGGSYPALELMGKNERPTYNGNDMALYSDVSSLSSEIADHETRLAALETSAIAVLSGSSTPTSEMGEEGAIYLAMEE